MKCYMTKQRMFVGQKKKKKKNHPIKSNFNCSHLTPNRVNFVLLEERNPRGENSF